MLKKIKKGIKKVANAAASVVNKAADAVADVVETIGNGIRDGLSWLGSKIPDGGVLGWLGDVVSGAAALVGAVIKGIGAIVGGLLSGLIKIVGGILTLDLDGIVDGLEDIGSGVAGAVIAIGGKAVALVQVVFTVGRPRPLNELERQLVALVFHESIATYNVRVVEGNAGLFSLNDRPFVLGNTIYMKKKNSRDNPDAFVHECVHVWQNQHVGSRYAAEALGSQWWGVAYEWEKEAEAGKQWEEFEREAQGALIEEVYRSGRTTAGVIGSGAFFAEDDETMRLFTFRRRDWTALANAATRVIRGRTPWRLSALASSASARPASVPGANP